jgi:hypothetical protein
LPITRRIDWWLAALLFATATIVGSAYAYVFDHTGARIPADLRTLSDRTMWFGQREFGAAVALACGRGFVDPGYALTPGLEAFLSLRADRFSCLELPEALPAHPPNFTQRLYRYLMWATAGVWAVRGVSWSGLWPLYGVLYGATVAVSYGLFRFGMGRSLACGAALAIMVSAMHLSNLPGLRDYAKAPFILGLLLIAAQLGSRINRPRSVLGLAALFGATLGLGFGFRNDIVIVIPLFLVALVAWDPPRDARAITTRIGATGVAAAAFTITAFPILSAYTRGSNSGHVAVMGLMSPFDRALQIAGSVYDWGHMYSDGFGDTLIKSYSYRVYGRPVSYLSAEYDRAMGDYLVQIARHWPADILARAYASVLTIVNLPFTPRLHAVPFGIDNSALLRLYEWQIRAIGVLEGAGVASVALALLVVSRTSVRHALLLLAALLYLGGYPAIQFRTRHFFHLEFVGWLALGFLAQRAAARVARIVEARRRGEPWAPVSWVAARRMATFGAIAFAIVAVPLAGARLYQQRHLRTFLRTYVEAPRERLPVEPVDAGDRRLLRTSTLWTDRDPQREIETQYIVAVFSAECPAARLPVTFRYDAARDSADYSLDTILTFERHGPPVEVFFPAYYVKGESWFDGVEVPRGFEQCVQEVTRVNNLDSLPLLLNLTLSAGWERTPLYQRLAAWERPTSPFPRVDARPLRLPVPRATLDEHLTPPAVLWRTPIVQGNPAGPWSITGTPKGPEWPVLEFAAQTRTADDRFVLEGEVLRGGFTVGLVSGERWMADGTVTIASPGRFAIVLAPPEPGAYGVLLANSLNDSWLLRHAPAPIVQLAGWVQRFNDVRIAKAGWVQRPVHTVFRQE